MSPLGPRLLLRDQFGTSRNLEGSPWSRVVWSEVVLAGLAAVPAVAVVTLAAQVVAVAGLLTATSILTGLTYTMALRFWERSIDARSDPIYLADGQRLYVIDKMRAHLVWTVLVGVVATGYLGLAVIFVSGAAPVWSSAVMTFLVLYQVILVGGALLRFYELSYLLRP